MVRVRMVFRTVLLNPSSESFCSFKLVRTCPFYTSPQVPVSNVSAELAWFSKRPCFSLWNTFKLSVKEHVALLEPEFLLGMPLQLPSVELQTCSGKTLNQSIMQYLHCWPGHQKEFQAHLLWCI